MTAVALETDGLTVRFGGVHALEGVSVSVPQGAIYGLVGPNGSGKTTLLNAVSGFVPATGQVLLLGHSISRWAPSRRAAHGLGRTFQTPKVSRNLSVWELLRIGDHLRREQPWWKVALTPWLAHQEELRMRARGAAVLESLGVSPALIDARVLSLAQGVIKMIDVARAVIAEPRVLLLDEPTAGMNEVEIQNLRARLKQLNDSGLTIVIVEHNIRFLVGVCTEVSVLNLGRKLCDGTPDEVFRRQDVVDAYLGEEEVARA